MIKFLLLTLTGLVCASCGTTGTTPVKQMSKDQFFAKQCFTHVKQAVFEYDGFNQKELRNCKVDPSYSYWNLKSRTSEYSKRPEVCSVKDTTFLTSNERLTKQLRCNGGRYGEPYHSTYSNIVEISCVQPWGQIVKRKYKCYLTENGNVESWKSTGN